MTEQARDWSQPEAAAEAVSLRLEELLEQPSPRRHSAASGYEPGVEIGWLAGFTAEGEPLVALNHGRTDDLSPARSTVPLDDSGVGRQVVLVFERGDRSKPIILGVIQSPVTATSSNCADAGRVVEVQRDGERVLVSAEREIVLRCGDASITLTRAGKVILRGTYVVSRSSGVNSIKGGSVQIN